MTITLEVVFELLNTQSNGHMNSIKIMFDEMKQEIRFIQRDVAKGKVSLEVTQSTCEESGSQLQDIETRLSMTEERLNEAVKQGGGMENL